MRIFLCLLFVLSCAIAVAQNSYIVSNVAGTSANFRSLQGAHDSVAAGSILYLMPSAASYGDAVFTKKLTVYGTGYFMGANLAPNTQANLGSITLHSITFRSGSDNSYIEGLQFTDRIINAGVNRILLDTVSNIVISRCLFTPPYKGYAAFFDIYNATNVVVQQCYFLTNGDPTSMINMYSAVLGFTGFQFRNNIVDYTANTSNAFIMVNGKPNGVAADALWINNTFLVNLWNGTFGNMNYSNNIMINTGGDYLSTNTGHELGGTNINNIVTEPVLFPVAGNNAMGANVDSMFVGSLAGYHSTDQKWMLRDTSYANTFGVGGVACGAFGGANPYKLSGIPTIPYIYSLSVPAQATAPGTIGVRIKARASN